MPSVSMTINGAVASGEVEARTLLVQFLREHQGLTGTHVGCDTSQCGACVVHVDGRAIKSCTLLALQAEGADVTTIEGLAENGELHPMPGMVLSAVDMVNRIPDLDEKTVRHELEGNFCRCTGYHNIVRAILDGAKAMRA